MALRGLPFLVSALSPTLSPAQARPQEPDPSALRISLPFSYLSGYAGDLKGEILTYHSPVPTIGTSLLVRSEDRQCEVNITPREIRVE